MLDRAGITLNNNTMPDDPAPPVRQASGVRIGTAAVTTQGMREPEMATIASLIGRVLRHRDDAAEMEVLRKEVVELCNRFTPYPRRGRRRRTSRPAWPTSRATPSSVGSPAPSPS